MAAANDGEDVAYHGSAGRGDDADALRIGRQCALAGGVEETFCKEARFELLEGELEGAGAARLQSFGDELQLPAALVDGDVATDQDSKTIGGAEAQELRLAPEEHDGKLGFAVFECQVDVAGGSGTAVGDLALDPDIGIAELDAAADIGNEGADAPDAALVRGCRERVRLGLRRGRSCGRRSVEVQPQLWQILSGGSCGRTSATSLQTQACESGWGVILLRHIAEFSSEGPVSGLAEAAKHPEDEAKDDAEQERSSEWKGDSPAATAPREISGKAAQREVESSKSHGHYSGHDKDGGEREQKAGDAGHCLCREEFAGAAQEFGGMAGFGQDGELAAHFRGALTDAVEAGVGSGQNEDAAGRLFAVHAGDQVEPVFIRHVDVAEQNLGRESTSALESFIRRVHGARGKAVLLKDET